VEALEDGRLEDNDRASLERHLPTCAACTRAKERLASLHEALRRIPHDEPAELDRRRARAELLARANGAVVAPRRGRPWRLALVAAVLVAVAGLLVGRRAALPSRGGEAAPRFEVTDVASADYTTTREGAMSGVTLRSGRASFQVDRVAPGARFVVRVPDGEVEVRGTRFVVDVAGGRTRAVEVSEGVVEVRVAGFTGVLRAGERWPAAAAAASGAGGPGPAVTAEPSGVTTNDAPPSSALAAPPTAPAAWSASPASSTAVAALPSAPAAAPSAATSAPAPPAASTVAAAPAAVTAPSASSSAADGAGVRFGQAVQSYRAGDYGEAERRFTAFVRDYPGDSRAEDAMFLVADGRARRGDERGAKAAALEYLRRYPDGLRAPAARRLAGAP